MSRMMSWTNSEGVPAAVSGIEDGGPSIWRLRTLSISGPSKGGLFAQSAYKVAPSP